MDGSELWSVGDKATKSSPQQFKLFFEAKPLNQRNYTFLYKTRINQEIVKSRLPLKVKDVETRFETLF